MWPSVSSWPASCFASLTFLDYKHYLGQQYLIPGGVTLGRFHPPAFGYLGKSWNDLAPTSSVLLTIFLTTPSRMMDLTTPSRMMNLTTPSRTMNLTTPSRTMTTLTKTWMVKLTMLTWHQMRGIHHLRDGSHHPGRDTPQGGPHSRPTRGQWLCPGAGCN